MALILLVISLSVTVLSLVFTSVYFLNRVAQRAALRNASIAADTPSASTTQEMR